MPSTRTPRSAAERPAVGWAGQRCVWSVLPPRGGTDHGLWGRSRGSPLHLATLVVPGVRQRRSLMSLSYHVLRILSRLSGCVGFSRGTGKRV